MNAFNKKSCLVTTYYGLNAQYPSKNDVKNKFLSDCEDEHLYINFDNSFDPWNMEHLSVGASRRKDLVYGKIFLLKNFIEKNILNKYDFLCHIDYSDVKFSKSFNEMVDKFINSGRDFIIATEKICWPDIDTVERWARKELKPKEFEYINSGCILSKVDIFYTYLNELIEICLKTNIDFWDDQGVWQYYHTSISPLVSDNICEYFFCTGLLDDTFYNMEDKKIKTKFDTYPYIIHDNSSFNLNLCQKL
jgi:hypothetical protein